MNDDIYENFQREKEVIEYLESKGESFKIAISTLFFMHRRETFGESFISAISNTNQEVKSEEQG